VLPHTRRAKKTFVPTVSWWQARLEGPRAERPTLPPPTDSPKRSCTCFRSGERALVGIGFGCFWAWLTGFSWLPWLTRWLGGWLAGCSPAGKDARMARGKVATNGPADAIATMVVCPHTRRYARRALGLRARLPGRAGKAPPCFSGAPPSR
jgi:hypothetical protein